MSRARTRPADPVFGEEITEAARMRFFRASIRGSHPPHNNSARHKEAEDERAVETRRDTDLARTSQVTARLRAIVDGYMLFPIYMPQARPRLGATTPRLDVLLRQCSVDFAESKRPFVSACGQDMSSLRHTRCCLGPRRVRKSRVWD